MFLLNSCLGHFSAAIFLWHSFSRSYGVILPSSLTTLLPPALGFSPHPPVSVYGTGTYETIAAFLGSWLTRFSTNVRSTSRFTFLTRIFLCDCYTLVPAFPFPARALLLRPHSSVHKQYRNFNLLSIDYDFRPRLRPPTYPGKISFTLETLDIRPLRFSLKSRYSFRHSLFLTLHCSLQYSFIDLRMLLYHPFGSTASVSCFSPGHFRRRASRLVSYYALFECMAASEPTS